MKKLINVALVAILFVVASCGSKSGLEGKWVQTMNEMGANIEVTYDFKGNGKCTQTMKMTSQTPNMNIEGEGTFDYKYEDNTITMTFSGGDFNFSKFEMEGLDGGMIDMAKEQMKNNMVNMTQTLNNVKIEGNKLTADFNGIQIEMTRK